MTDEQERSSLKAVVNDCAATLCRQIDAASDHAALNEIARRISGFPAMLTPTK